MIDEVKSLLKDALQLGDRAEALDADSGLLGELPEMDSMAVVTILTALEDHYGFIVEDDEITVETFETLGTLTQFVEEKINA